MAYTRLLTLNLGSGSTGLNDLRAQLLDTAGATVGSEISTGFVELGGGSYSWLYAAFPDGFRGSVKFYRSGSAASPLVAGAINPEEAEYTDAKTSTRAIPGDAMTLAAGAVSAAAIADNALDAAALAADAVTEIANAVAVAVGAGAPDPDECELYGYLRRNGEWAANVVVTCELAAPPLVADGALMFSRKRETYTAPNGRFSFIEARGASVRLRVSDAGVDETFTVPDAATYDVSEIVA